METPALLIKYRQTSDPCCPPPFFTGEQNVPNFGPNFDPSRLRTAVFLNRALYRKTKTNLSRTDDRSTTTPNLGGSPQLPEPLAHLVTQKVKVENFFYILHSSGPGRVQRHQCYTICWGRGCCKKVTVPHLPIRPLHFTGGQKLAHTRVNLGPRHISETITGRKLKFYTHLDRTKCSFRA